ncbi:MAG: hypothetical protein FWC59_02355, partial [Actinomycetia bacterium]|nr:hypothetical protein [Actinomycetes bacterium]
MVQSANAFQLDSQIAPAELPRPQSERRAVLRVLPAPAPLAAPATLAQPRVRLNSTFVTILVALVLLALAAFTYIWLVNSTMRQTVVTGQLRNEISQSRSLGHDLESQYSALANPQNIQQQARALAMVPDNSPEYLYL